MPAPGRSTRARAFTIIELVLGAAILSVVVGAVLALTMTGQDVYATSSHQQQAVSRANAVMDRILQELRQASLKGEDLDEDDDPDDLEREDLNGNGRIDDDWSLGDGETAETISFNASRRGGLYTDRLTFRFDGNRVWRDSGSTAPVSAVIAEDVTALTFTRQGRRVIVNVIVDSGIVGPGRTGKTISLIREVVLRN